MPDQDVTSDQRFVSELFPRASKYHPDWIMAGASGDANSLWLTEWLSAVDARPVVPSLGVLVAPALGTNGHHGH